jgi:hypothetical protein
MRGQRPAPLRLAHGGKDRRSAPEAQAHLQGRHPRDEQMPRRGLLGISERQHASLAQRIAAIAGEHVKQVVHVAQAVHVPLEAVVVARPSGQKPLGLVDEPLCGHPSLSMKSQ